MVDPKATEGLATAFAAAAKSGGVPMMTYQGQEVTVASVMELARLKNPVPDAVTALQALRMEMVDLYVRATCDFSPLFETINLQPNELPMIDHSYRNPVAVRYSGEDGGTRGVKAVKARKQITFNMRELHSDSVGYQMRDINLGTDVAAASQATVDVAWDITHKLNVEKFNFLQGGVINGKNYGTGVYGNFTTTGAKLDRTFVLHPGIQSANLPTTNLISYATLAGMGHTGTQISFYVIQAIIDYVESFRGIFSDGDLEATGLILIPSSETTGLLKTVTPTGQFYTKIGEQIQNSFTRIEYGGRVWTLMGTPFLPKGACYPVLNKKLGNYYVKPTFDFEDVQSDRLKNWEERTAVKVMALATVEPWRVNGLKVVYSNLANAGRVITNA